MPNTTSPIIMNRYAKLFLPPYTLYEIYFFIAAGILATLVTIFLKWLQGVAIPRFDWRRECLKNVREIRGLLKPKSAGTKEEARQRIKRVHNLLMDAETMLFDERLFNRAYRMRGTRRNNYEE